MLNRLVIKVFKYDMRKVFIQDSRQPVPTLAFLGGQLELVDRFE